MEAAETRERSAASLSAAGIAETGWKQRLDRLERHDSMKRSFSIRALSCSRRLRLAAGASKEQRSGPGLPIAK